MHDEFERALQSALEAEPPVVLRGTGRGLEVVVADGIDPRVVISSLESQLVASPQFFARTDVTLRFSSQPGTAVLAPLESILAKHEMKIVGVCVGDDELGPTLLERVRQRKGRPSAPSLDGPTRPHKAASTAVPEPPRVPASAAPNASANGQRGRGWGRRREGGRRRPPPKPPAEFAETLLPKPGARNPGPAPRTRVSATNEAKVKPSRSAAPKTAASAKANARGTLTSMRAAAKPSPVSVPDAPAKSVSDVCPTAKYPVIGDPIASADPVAHSDSNSTEPAPSLARGPIAIKAPTNGKAASKSITSWADPKPAKEPQSKPAKALESEFSAAPVMVRGPVRSGMKLESEGHLIVVGDVNPGAELRAAGNVIVLGCLRGIAHAGYESEKGFVWALQLKAQQLRIGSLVARAGDSEPQDLAAEIAFASEGRIVVETYNGRFPPAAGTITF